MKTEIRKTYFPNGKLFSEHSYINGIQHGIQKDYFGCGLVTFWNCQNGEITGISQIFHNDGTILKINQYRKDILNGLEIIIKY